MKKKKQRLAMLIEVKNAELSLEPWPTELGTPHKSSNIFLASPLKTSPKDQISRSPGG
jgi:hypothetical protein